MDEVKKTRLVLTAMILGFAAGFVLAVFALLILSIFWLVPLWKGLAISIMAGITLGAGAFYKLSAA